jgi:multidrug efflux pump subunit AcrB
VNEVQFSLLLSVALVVMVIFLFLRRFWPTFIACVSVPLSLAGTFAVMYLLHYSLDNLSLMAVTISVGFVVDDAIVVIENVFRFIEEGDTPMEATIKGTRQIGFTIISMSLSLIAVFIPLLFMTGIIGRLFHEFAVTLSAAILVSGVISLTLTPMLCSRFLKGEAAYGHRMNIVQRWSESGFNWLVSHYEHSLKWVLRHQAVMLVVFVLTIISTVGLAFIVPRGIFPQQDTGLISGTTDASQDISFAAMSDLQLKCARILMDDPAIETFGSFIGSSYQASTVNNGRFFITLKSRDKRNVSADQIINRLRKKLAVVPGVALFLQANQDIILTGRSTKAQFSYTLQSSDLDELNKWAPKFLAKLREHPQLKDLNSDQQTKGLKTNVVVDRDAASRLGVSALDVDNTLYDAFGQRQVSVVYEQYNQHHIILEVEPKYLSDPQYLSTIYVKSKTGQMVPLSAVSKIETTNAFLSVNHQGQFPSVTFSFNLAPGVSLSDITGMFQNASREINMPSTIHGAFSGTAQAFQQSQAAFLVLIGAALICVYIVLGMLYESLIHPLTIISTLISAGLGALLALLLFRVDLSLVSFIGIILLMGIVKKNGILMVDFAIEAERNDGLSPEDAIFKACIIRFRPIMMTTMAAMLGAVPLAIGMGEGSELRQPLGISVVGGLLVSQVLTLYTTPVIYPFIEHLRQWVLGRRPSPVGQLALEGN